jgi:hypothetical protein
MGQKRNTYRVLVRKTVRKRLPGRPSRRWENIIKVHVEKMGAYELAWIQIGFF